MVNPVLSTRQWTTLCATTLVMAAGLVAVKTTADAAPTNDPTCATPVNGTPAGPTGPSATGYVLNVGQLGTVHDPSGNPQVSAPGAVGVDIVGAGGLPARKVFASFSTVPDVGTSNPVNTRVVSTDGGATFPAASYAQAPPPSNATRLRDGTILGYDFKPIAVTSRTATFRAYRSTDDGTTWTSSDAVFDLGAATAGGAPRTHGAVLELADGTILVSIYAPFTDHPAGVVRSQVEASTDGGYTFARRGVIAEPTEADSYPEAAIGQLPNGHLLSVIRHQRPGNVLATPVYTTSVDGRSWAPLSTLAVSFPNGYDPLDDGSSALLGIAPQLRLLPNGVMVLSSGRPDNWIAVSTNGHGTGWIGQLTYRNCPTNGYRFHGSTGNTGITPVASNRLLQVGDNCESTWSCVQPDETGFTIDKQNRIWRRFVDVLTPDVGKIDLATKYNQGRIGVATDMAWTEPAHPRARVDGTFDGSTEYWSSAVRAGGSGSYVVTLDRAYTLTRVGLSLRNGRTATGRVYASTDGVTWGQPIVSATDRTHYAVEYFPLAQPVSARYVKVEVDASTTCEPGLGAGCAFLNELELYSTVDSFENDPVGNRPRGYTDISQGWVTNGGLDGDDSGRALRLSDGSDQSQAKVRWAGSAGPTKTLEFRLNPVAMPNAFLFTLIGHDTSGAEVPAFHFALRGDGSIARFHGGTWQAITATHVVDVGTWSTIRVSAATNGATLTINGATVATNVAPTTNAAALFAYSFASNGTVTTGDQYLIDDVLFAGAQ